MYKKHKRDITMKQITVKLTPIKLNTINLTVLLAVFLTLTMLSSNAFANPQNVHNKHHKPGKVIRHIPSNSVSVRFNGAVFNTHNGTYYRKHSRGYREVMPPRGLHIRLLPRYHSRLRHRNNTYYTYQNVYYIAENNGYTVVDTPKIQVNRAIKVNNTSSYKLGQFYDSLPTAAKPVTISSVQYFKYDDIYFLPQISGDEIKYLAVKLN